MNRGKTRPYSLQQAASLVFALTAVLPLLVFAWTLYRVDAMSSPQAQIGLGLALAAALLGFYIFRTLMGRMSELIQAVGKATELGARTAVGAGTLRPPSGLALAPPADPGASGVEAAGEPPEDGGLPGIGAIQEVRGLTQAMAMLWKTEALALRGQRVLVSVMNSPQAIAGLLVEATDDGLLLEQEAGVVGVTYRRISAIDVARTPGEPETR